jgi:hypothetical protein
VLTDRSPINPAPKTPRRHLPEGYDTSKWPDDPTQGHKNRLIQPSLFGYVVGSLFILVGSFMVVADFVALARLAKYMYSRGVEDGGPRLRRITQGGGFCGSSTSFSAHSLWWKALGTFGQGKAAIVHELRTGVRSNSALLTDACAAALRAFSAAQRGR